MTGRLIAVVGPSGVGKDSVIRALTEARPELGWVRRVITRPPEPHGEAHRSVSQDRFAALKASGAFCLDWQAHNLLYGIPKTALDDVHAGHERIVNLSRGALAHANDVFPRLTVLSVIASPETLARRLHARGREETSQIAKRLARSGANLPEGLDVTTLHNDGSLAETLAQALAALKQERA